MIKKILNQNAKYVQKLLDDIEPDFIFNNNPINRLKVPNNGEKNSDHNKKEKLSNLVKQINSIENCNLKNNSKNLVVGEGNLNSPLMIIGEAPGEIEDQSGSPFQGETGSLLNKMLKAINIDRENIYLAYSIGFRPPKDRKPTTLEIKRYSNFLKDHISIIDPKILVLMGSTAMEAVTGLNEKISNVRGIWKEIILGSATIPIMITFSPSYLLRVPENKRYSWEDLKEIKKKIKDLNLKI